MKLYYSLFFLLGLTLMVQPKSLLAKKYEKTIERSFDITKNGTTAISNKYGKVTLQTWDKNVVSIKVVIQAETDSKKEAQEAFDRVTINFLSSTDRVSAKTEIESKNTSWWSWDFTRVDYNIDYVVFLPISNNLELVHKYGNFSLNELEGELSVQLGYGKGVIERLGDNGNLNISYANISVEEAKNLKVSMKYSDLRVGAMNDLEIESKYSKIEIENALSITTYSKYDHFNIGTLNNLRNSGKFDHFEIRDIKNLEILSQYTDVEVEKIREVIELDLKYGGGNLGLGRNFKSVILNGEHSNFKIEVEDGSYFDFILDSKYADIKIPEMVDFKKDIQTSTERIIEGTFTEGVSNQPKGIMKIMLQYGGIKLED
jgi:hypothetical protein